jgi:hypothetical protein
MESSEAFMTRFIAVALLLAATVAALTSALPSA